MDQSRITTRRAALSAVSAAGLDPSRQWIRICLTIPCSICDRPSGAVAMQSSTYSPGLKFASKKDSIPDAIAAMPPAPVTRLSSAGGGSAA